MVDERIAEVYYVDAVENEDISILNKLEKLFNDTIGPKIKKGERVCLKVHFGQHGNVAYMRPSIIRKMVDLIKSRGASVTLAETTGLGFGTGGRYGGRGTASDYITMAATQGFAMGTMGAPIIMLDGELGADTIMYFQDDAEFIKKVAVARGIISFDKIIVFSHAKGHGIGGFGGAIKNLGIGMVGKYTKADCHYLINEVEFDHNNCMGPSCGECLKKCPEKCIYFNDEEKIEIDLERCIRCGHCVSTCRNVVKKNVIKIRWNENLEEQATRFAESAAGVVRFCKEHGHELYFFNVVMDVSPLCDCIGITPTYIAPNLGILASSDPVAIDQASIDLINNAPPYPGSKVSTLSPGEDKFAVIGGKEVNGKFVPSRRHWLQLERAEKMNIGTRKYDLIKIQIERPKKQGHP